MFHFSFEAAIDLATRAAIAAGASAAAARSMALATTEAEGGGQTSLGFEHLFDYLDGIRAGRIDGSAEPEITSPAPALIRVDAKQNIGQLGFDMAFADLVDRALTYGIALFTQGNSFTTGELGYYARRLAERGLVAFAATNGPALMTVPGGRSPVFCTNPFAFAAPRDGAAPLLIDQASSATAYVNVRQAAARGETIPAGWAIDAAGLPTTDPKEAMKGALLTFGGARGANVALMVEVLAAGLGDANWSLDAPGFTSGTASPGAGLTVIAIAPVLLRPDFSARLAEHCARLAALGVHIPGEEKAKRLALARSEGLHLPEELTRRIAAYTTC